MRVVLSLFGSLLVAIALNGPARAELPAEVQADIKKGQIAADQNDFPLAIRYFNEAREGRPYEPEILGDLGIVESKIPGRELRAIVWFGAYLAANPSASNAAAVRGMIDALRIKNESNLNHFLETLTAAATELGLPDHKGTGEVKSVVFNRYTALYNAAAAWARIGNLDAARKALGLIPSNEVIGYLDRDVKAATVKYAQYLAEGRNAARLKKLPDTLSARDLDSVNDRLAEAAAKDGDINAALSTLPSIADRDYLDYALSTIAVAQAEAGDNAGSCNSVSRISPSKQSAKALELAKEVLSGYDTSGARIFEPLITDQSDRDDFLSTLSFTWLYLGDSALAEKTAALISQNGRRISAQQSIQHSIAYRYISVGDLDRAKQVAESMTLANGNDDQADTELQIADAYLGRKDLVAARAMITLAANQLEQLKSGEHFDSKNNDVPQHLFSRFAAIGDFAAAKAAAAEIDSIAQRAAALFAIARAEWQAGEKATASRTLEVGKSLLDHPGQIDSYWLGWAQRLLASTYASMGRRADATTAALQIVELYDRGEALVDIASALNKAGDLSGARAALTDAYSVTRSNPRNKERLLEEIAEKYADLGDINTARASIDDIGNPGERIRGGIAVSKSQNHVGDLIGANVTLQRALAEISVFQVPDRVDYYLNVAEAQAKANEMAAARTTFSLARQSAAQMPSIPRRRHARKDIADAELRAGLTPTPGFSSGANQKEDTPPPSARSSTNSVDKWLEALSEKPEILDFARFIRDLAAKPTDTWAAKAFGPDSREAYFQKLDDLASSLIDVQARVGALVDRYVDVGTR